MFFEMVNPACVVNTHDKSINSIFLGWRAGVKPVRCLDKQQIFNLVGPCEINSKVLKKATS